MTWQDPEPRLPSETWIMGHLRQCHSQGIMATVLHRGEKTGGLLLLKLYLGRDQNRLQSQTRDLDGALAWFPAFEGKTVDDREAEAYIAKQKSRDPDLWVIEIEHPEGWHPFEGSLL